MKTNQEFLLEIKAAIEESTKRPIDIELKEESRLNEDLGLDSIELLYLVMAVENKFGISFENDEINSIKNCGQIIELLRKKI